MIKTQHFNVKLRQYWYNDDPLVMQFVFNIYSIRAGSSPVASSIYHEPKSGFLMLSTENSDRIVTKCLIWTGLLFVLYQLPMCDLAC